jgi:hypothetical protein
LGPHLRPTWELILRPMGVWWEPTLHLTLESNLRSMGMWSRPSMR